MSAEHSHTSRWFNVGSDQPVRSDGNQSCHPRNPLPFLYTDQSEFILLRHGDGLYIDKTQPLLSLLAPAPGSPSLLRNKYIFLARPGTSASPCW